MSRIKTIAAASAIVVFSLGFGAARAAPSLAEVERTMIYPHSPMYRHVTYRSNGLSSGSELQLAPEIADGPCDPPSAGCSDDERYGPADLDLRLPEASCDLPSPGCSSDERIRDSRRQLREGRAI